jgi:hypothetical protein
MDLRGLESPLQGTLFLFTGNYQHAHPVAADRLRDATFALALAGLALGAGLFWSVTGPASQQSAADVLMHFLS